MKIIFVVIFAVLLSVPVFAQVKAHVFTDSDLHRYEYGSSDNASGQGSYSSEQERFGNSTQGTQTVTVRRSSDEGAQGKQAALKEIRKLEEEAAQDKKQAEWDRETLHNEGLLEINNRARQERAAKRQVELDDAYRRAGLSREREMQKRTREAERRERAAENRAAAAEAQDRTNEMNESTPKTYIDTNTGRTVTCNNGFCN